MKRRCLELLVREALPDAPKDLFDLFERSNGPIQLAVNHQNAALVACLLNRSFLQAFFFGHCCVGIHLEAQQVIAGAQGV
jgi:hypothetical protein